MLLPSLNAALRRTTALALAVFLSLPGWAQDAQQTAQPTASQPPQTPQPQQFVLKDYSKPRSHFPNPIGPYIPRHVEPPVLNNTPRIEDLLRDGKLYLSINDAVALALENNLDIAIQRYNMEIADTDILRTKAGASFLGVNSGLVQGTPGGGTGGLSGTVGSGTGGTAAGAGGAGAGAGGLVTSTLGSGPQITSFDPALTGTLQWDHASFIPTSPFAGTAQNTTTGNFAYQQGFQWGTTMSVGFSNSRVTSNNAFTIVSPALSSNFQFKLTQ
ncbi:MAG TPA: TolC family protein, partial [Terriglobales bacterium]|nr:TolC family protein [Terriglobales bacterium]